MVVFLQPTTSTPRLTRFALTILHALSVDARTILALRANSSAAVNLRKLTSSSGPQKTQAEAILARLDSADSSAPQPSLDSGDTTKACVTCGATNLH